jgi:hypothetical protein
MIRKTIILILLFFTLKLPFAWCESVELYLHLQDIEHARLPEVYGGYLVFSYEAQGHAYIVAARFSHENYTILHNFRKNDNNIFVLAIPAPPESTLIKYRFMVDGVWTHDPANPTSEKDAVGNVLSLLSFEKTDDTPVESPRLLENGFVEFSLRANSGSFVTIAGDFNAYDPFSHRLKETATGLYSVRVKLIPGNHYYYFVVDGLPLVDPRNERMVVDGDRHRLSVVTIP